MSRIIFCPSIGLDVTLIERLANSIDTHFDFAVAWNNGPLGALDQFAGRHPDWIVKDSAFGNLGCAGSWNEAAKLFPDEPIVLINEDVQLLPGYLERIFRVSQACVDTVPIVYLNETRGFYCFVWHPISRREIGLFDDNLFPAYYEDGDYRIRIEKSGMIVQLALPGEPPVIHGKPSTGGINYSAMLQGCGLLNRAYLLRKWGTQDCDKPVYTTPYNDHRLTHRDVVWYPEEREARWKLWSTFMSLPNPSIYT